MSDIKIDSRAPRAWVRDGYVYTTSLFIARQWDGEVESYAEFELDDELFNPGLNPSSSLWRLRIPSDE